MRSPMRHGIVGFGKIGQLIAAQIAQSDGSIVKIDPRFQGQFEASNAYPSIEAVDDHLAQSIDCWFVCTPTETHHKVCETIIRRNPRAAILIEKPLCHKADLPLFDRISALDRPGYVRVDNHYIECRNIKVAQAYLQDHPSHPRRITIGFFKNRVHDELNGRSVDRELGMWGYEGFHMLTLLLEFLPDDAAQDYMANSGASEYRSGVDPLRSWVAEQTRLPSGLEISISTSVNGVVLDHDLHQTGLLTGIDRRRHLSIDMDNGDRFSLYFGCQRDAPTSPGNYYGFSLSRRDCCVNVWTEESPLGRHIREFSARNLRRQTTLSYARILTERLITQASQTPNLLTI